VPADDQPLEWASLRRLHREHLALLRVRPWLADLARHPPPERVAVRLAPALARLIGLWPRALAAGLIRTDLPADLVMAMIRGLDEAIDRWWVEHPEATWADADRAYETLRALVVPR
jgi:hypothetical protein